MSSITKCLNTSTICREVARCDKKLCVVLIEADIFNKAVQGNIPKPLRNLYIKVDVNTLRHCGEMACVEEYLHTFGNSDITTYSVKFSLGANFRDFRADRPASAKIKTAKRWKLMTSLRAYVEYRCEHDGSLQSVCPLNGCCKEESASYCTKYQQTRKRRSEDVASTGRGVVRASRIPRKYKTAKISSEEPGCFSAKICTSEIFPLYGIPRTVKLPTSSRIYSQVYLCNHTAF